MKKLPILLGLLGLVTISFTQKTHTLSLEKLRAFKDRLFTEERTTQAGNIAGGFILGSLQLPLLYIGMDPDNYYEYYLLKKANPQSFRVAAAVGVSWPFLLIHSWLTYQSIYNTAMSRGKCVAELALWLFTLALTGGMVHESIEGTEE